MIQLGYFGKTIHRGDFVRFNLPKAFITVMDDWLQSVMINGESTHTDQWPERYTQCPGYSFHLSPNIAGDSRWSGVIGASRDKVGRRFPFVIAAGLPDNYPATWTLTALNEHISEFAALLNKIQATDFEFDSLQEELGSLSQSMNNAIDTDVKGSYQSYGLLGPEEFALTTTGLQPGLAVEATGSVLDIVLRLSYFNHSVWVPLNASALFRGLVTSGLPNEKAALALFDNEWESVPADILDTPGHATTSEKSMDLHSEPLAELAIASPVDPNRDFDKHNQVTEQDAWSALNNAQIEKKQDQANSKPVDEKIHTPPKPKIEPLELEEDSSTKAPWD